MKTRGSPPTGYILKERKEKRVLTNYEDTRTEIKQREKIALRDLVYPWFDQRGNILASLYYVTTKRTPPWKICLQPWTVDGIELKKKTIISLSPDTPGHDDSYLHVERYWSTSFHPLSDLQWLQMNWVMDTNWIA
jgi:hypothetical protein